jgi:hypothetical protein
MKECEHSWDGKYIAEQGKRPDNEKDGTVILRCIKCGFEKIIKIIMEEKNGVFNLSLGKEEG